MFSHLADIVNECHQWSLLNSLDQQFKICDNHLRTLSSEDDLFLQSAFLAGYCAPQKNENVAFSLQNMNRRTINVHSYYLLSIYLDRIIVYLIGHGLVSYIIYVVMYLA